MDKRYWIEELVQTGPDDAEWQIQDSHDLFSDAVGMAAKRIKPTEHGDSGVRVYDSVERRVMWGNMGHYCKGCHLFIEPAMAFKEASEREICDSCYEDEKTKAYMEPN